MTEDLRRLGVRPSADGVAAHIRRLLARRPMLAEQIRTLYAEAETESENAAAGHRVVALLADDPVFVIGISLMPASQNIYLVNAIADICEELVRDHNRPSA